MPGLYSGFAPGGAVEGLKRLWGAVTGSEPPLTLGEATGTPVPQAQVSQEPKIGADPRPAPVRALQNAMSDYGLNSEDFTNPNTQPPLRVLGAVRDINSRIMDSPVGQIGQAITMFKTPAERMEGTARFRAASEKLGGNLNTAGQEFANKYPRIAAHAVPQLDPQPMNSYGQTAAAYAREPERTLEGVFKYPATIGVTPSGVESSEPTPHFEHPDDVSFTISPEAKADALRNAHDMMFHEGTHVAQYLGNKDFRPLYDNAHAMTGYYNNPFEIQARYSGARNSHEGIMNRNNIGEGQTAITGLKDIARETLQEHMTRLARAMEDQGISLDMSYGGNSGKLNEVRLRKWGAENTPENLVDPKTLPGNVQTDLQKLTTNMRPVGTPDEAKNRTAIRNLLRLREEMPMKPVSSHEVDESSDDPDLLKRIQNRNARADISRSWRK